MTIRRFFPFSVFFGLALFAGGCESKKDATNTAGAMDPKVDEKPAELSPPAVAAPTTMPAKTEADNAAQGLAGLGGSGGGAPASPAPVVQHAGPGQAAAKGAPLGHAAPQPAAYAPPALAAQDKLKANEERGGGVRTPHADPLAAKPVAVQPAVQGPRDFGNRAQHNAPAPVATTAFEAPTAPVAVVPKLDPNARYATTYRPGGAALAAFDSAVQKGDIPAEYKDLVGDFGARYAPQMDAPTTSALSFKMETERAKIPPSGGLTNFRVAIRSSAAETKRAPLSVHLVLDVSGSMSGTAIDNARKAAASLVERLDAADDFSLVTFSSSAEVKVVDGPVGPRRKQILSTISEVTANGGTNISAGLDLGYVEAHKPQISPEAVKIVMLLSDGHANGGDTNPQTLSQRSARAFQDGIQTSSFGLGADFDAPLMSSIADRGAGGYYYLADSSQIANALAKEMDSRLVPAALGVEVRVRLRPDVSPTRVYGSRALDQVEAAQVRAQEVSMDNNAAKKGIAKDRQEDTVGGMRFFMPAFARDDRHAILIQLQLPPGTGERALASVEVKYKDRIQKKNVTEEFPVKIAYATDDADSAASANASVVATVQAFLAGDTIVAAERLVGETQRVPAMRMLQERAEIMKRAAVSLNEARLGEDAIRLARLSRAVGGPSQMKDELPLAVLLRGSSYGYLK